jgi:hypothetical protein
MKWRREKDVTTGQHRYYSINGHWAIYPTNYHPQYGYAHKDGPKARFWQLSRRDEKLGVAPDYWVDQRSYFKKEKAAKAAQEFEDRNPELFKVLEAYRNFQSTGQVRPIILEGGNVFDDVSPFKHEVIGDILAVVNDALGGTGIQAIPVGSGATPTPGKISGDLDVMADEKAVIDYFKAKDAKSARAALKAYIESKGLKAAQSGINVHVRVPVGGEAHQVDIMVSPNAEKIAKLHIHDIPKGSPYKGVNKHLVIAILAKSKGLMWSPWQGLFQRTPEGKKGDFLTNDLDEIAKAILSPKANAKNVGSVEAILNSLPPAEAKILLAKAKEDPNWKEQ